jgi:hypothetical protein
MAFDIGMIKAHYAALPGKIKQIREKLDRQLEKQEIMNAIKTESKSLMYYLKMDLSDRFYPAIGLAAMFLLLGWMDDDYSMNKIIGLAMAASAVSIYVHQNKLKNLTSSSEAVLTNLKSHRKIIKSEIKVEFIIGIIAMSFILACLIVPIWGGDQEALQFLIFGFFGGIILAAIVWRFSKYSLRNKLRRIEENIKSLKELEGA